MCGGGGGGYTSQVILRLSVQATGSTKETLKSQDYLHTALSVSLVLSLYMYVHVCVE